MTCDLNDKFDVIIGNIKMEYNTIPIIYHCKNWANEILNEKKLNIDISITSDINSIKNFFDGLSKSSVDINPNNCKTIRDLATLAGANKIIENATNIYNESQRTTPEVAEELINESRNSDTNMHHNEDHLSRHYNELLRIPHILKNIEIQQHYRILEKAIQYDKANFNIHSFLNFLIDSLENDDSKDYSILLSLLNPMDFDIDEFDRLSKCKNFDGSCLTYDCTDFIAKIKQNNEKILQQEEKIREMQRNQELITNQFNELKDLLNNGIDTIVKCQGNNLTQSIEFVNQNISNVQSEFNSKIDSCNEQIQSQSNNLATSLNEVKQSTISLAHDIGNVKNELNSKIQSQSTDFAGKFEMYQSSLNEIKQQAAGLTQKIEATNQATGSAKDELNRKVDSCKDQIQSQTTELNRSLETQKNLINDIKQQTINAIQKVELNDKSINDAKNEINNKIEACQSQIQNESKIITKSVEVQQSSSNEIKKINQDLTIIKQKIEDHYIHNKLILKKDYYDDKFSGIFATLTKSHGNNINDIGLIHITGKGQYGGTLSSLVDFNYTGYGYFTSDDQNSFICFDFRNYCISVSAYSWKTSKYSPCYYMRSWIVEGSNNESEWTLLDSHSNDTTMCSKFTSYTFQIKEANIIMQPFRFIRFRLTGKTSRDNYQIEATNIEFFGKLFQI